MTTITKGQALCMFYLESYTEENVMKLTETLEEMGNLEICYLDDPTEPVLAHKLVIKHRPFRYHTYIDKIDTSATDNESSTTQSPYLTNVAQLIQFLNIVYLAHNPDNNEVYEYKDVTMKQVLNTVWNYCDLFDKKTLYSFGKWCSDQKLDFLLASTKRKSLGNDESIRARPLYVMKAEYLDDIATKLVQYLPQYQNYIRALKDDGYTLIGYIRKSPGPESTETRVNLLRSMCKSLEGRSLVDFVFASYSCRASDPIEERDTKPNEAMKQLNVSGHTQDMIELISKKTNVCLVALDHAGFSTNCADIQRFLCSHPQIKKIIIDLLPYTNETIIYDRRHLLDDPKNLKVFDCRRASYQRSK
ncbi:hypothetical protein DM01DRAFT_1306345 [Hesseltinella vesiculosa]|uniref:Uncharacterized protein n=1 Tax=Hesseltinella vesiculosa TaxID=101127 RepID=A0A1X2GFJ3_9FUNG|nr:hypothetical protein DM01DRAFT_1306345 [Hesseltinella vesiculosa]